MDDLEKQIEVAADNYSILENGKARESQFFEITEKGLDYQVTKAFISGVNSEVAKLFHQNGMYSEEELEDLMLEFSWRHDKRVTFKEWFKGNKKKGKEFDGCVSFSADWS
jgi:hypothetical protein